MEINAKQPAALRDLTNFGELAVRAHAVDDVHLQAMLGAAGWGLLEGDHAWLQVGVLRAAGAGLGDDWERAFEGMLEYAGTQGGYPPTGSPSARTWNGPRRPSPWTRPTFPGNSPRPARRGHYILLLTFFVASAVHGSSGQGWRG